MILLLSVGVRVLPGDDVVSEQWGHQVDLEEVFVQIFPVRPGGDLVHGGLQAGWLSVHDEGWQIVIITPLTRKWQS